jgi:EpsI family protein
MLKQPRVLASLAVLGLLTLYVLVFPPWKTAGTRLESCPMTLAGYPGTKLSLTQTVLDDLNPDDYLIREYDRADGLPIWLVIVYFQNARLGAHDPLLCYRSQGFKVETLPEAHLQTALGVVPIQIFRAVKGNRAELVYYFWYAAGGQVLAEVKAWRDRMFFQGVRTNRSFGAFVRVSTIERNDPAGAAGSLQSVIRDLAPLLPGFFPEGTQAAAGTNR